MPLSIRTRYGEYHSVYLEAYSTRGHGGLTPYLYAEREHCPATVMTIRMLAPSGIIAEAIEEEKDKMQGHRIEEIIHYLRTGEHNWQTARDTTSNRLRILDRREGYTPYPWTAVERMLEGVRRAREDLRHIR